MSLSNFLLRISRWIWPSRGVHQGCCISPHLFNLTGQIFANILEHNKEIDGITAHGIFLLLAQFADDTSLFLKSSEKEIKSVTESLNLAERNLGLKVNYEKTTIYRIGSLMRTKAEYYTQQKFCWDDPPVHTLGIIVDINVNRMIKMNMNPILEKAQGVLKTWNYPDLSLTGRVLVVNTFVESLCVYRFSVLPYLVHGDIYTELNKLIMNFIWRGKRAKINFNILKQPKDEGGLRLVDLRSKHIALLIQWLFVKDEFVQARYTRKLKNTIREWNMVL